MLPISFGGTTFIALRILLPPSLISHTHHQASLTSLDNECSKHKALYLNHLIASMGSGICVKMCALVMALFLYEHL